MRRARRPRAHAHPHHYFWKSAKWVRACGSNRATSPASGNKRLPQPGAHGEQRYSGADLAVAESSRSSPRHRVRRSSSTPGWPGHRGPARRCSVAAEDGYQAEREVTCRLGVHGTRVAPTVQRLRTAKLPLLTDEASAGPDRTAARSAYFVWEPSGGPARSSARGRWIGIVPLWRLSIAPPPTTTETRLLSHAPGRRHLSRRTERLSGNGPTVVHALTDSQPSGWTSYACVSTPRCWLRSRLRRQTAAFLRVDDAVRRGGGRIARAARTRSPSDQDRTLRTHRTVT